MNSSKRHLTWKDLSMEFIAGLFFAVAMATLMYFTIFLGNRSLFGEKITRPVAFRDVSGLTKGDNVQLYGVVVGRVEEMTLEKTGVTVWLRLDRKIPFYNDHKIEVRYSSVLGGRYIALSPGTESSGVYAPERPLRGLEAADLVNETTALVQSLKEEVNHIRDTLEKEQVLPKVARFVDNLNAMSEDLRAGKGTLGKLMQDPELYNQANTALAAVKVASDNLGGLTGDLRAGKGTLGKLMTDDGLYTDLKGITGDLRAGKGTAGKLLTDDRVYNDLQAVTHDFRTISETMVRGESSMGRLLMDKGELYISLRSTLSAAEEVAEAVRSGKGTLGKLAMDPALYNDTRQTILEVRGAVQDFREQAPVSTFGSLIFGAF